MSKINNYKFSFNIRDKVKITDLDIKGRITAIFIDSNTIQYNIKYFYNGGAKTLYCEESELELCGNDEKLGFLNNNDKKS